jgi:translation initiation factor eIF-2B subunit beta
LLFFALFRELILTFGVSHTVAAFLKEAAKFRTFSVIVAESAPSYAGHTQALALRTLGIDTTVISDSAVFALMPSVHKVIVGTHGVMANGGLVAHTGAANLARAARHHAVPFVVVTALHKLCPLYAFDNDTFNEQGAPSQLLKFDELSFDGDVDCMLAAAGVGESDGDGVANGGLEDEPKDAASLLTVLNPAFDYVEPNFVSLFITNMSAHKHSSCTLLWEIFASHCAYVRLCGFFADRSLYHRGGHNPSYIYRLLAEYYDPQDYTL